jgi:Domain of unknown function (DUF222)/HNH endonuclease
LTGGAGHRNIEHVFDGMARIRADVAHLASEPLAGLPGAAQSARVRDLVELKERLEAELMRSVGQWDAEGCWAEDGAVSAASWLATQTSLPRAAAGRLVRAARLLGEHETTAVALASGAVTSVQVDTLATLTRNREDLYPAAEDALLTAAEALGADDFAAVARHWRSVVDDSLASADALAVHERRYLYASKTLFGTVRIDGELDLDGGETLLAALAALDQPETEVDGMRARTGRQRNADNLVQMAAAYLAGGATNARPEVAASVVIDLDTLVGAESRSLHEARRELQHLGPIAQETALRLACDASVIRAVMSGSSEVLDLGRSTPVVSRAQRRALLLRDRGCGFPGCDRPPEWCDAHHIWHWVKGGPTDIGNLVLLCRHHHVLCHEGGWHLARGPDGALQFRRPDGSELVLAC